MPQKVMSISTKRNSDGTVEFIFGNPNGGAVEVQVINGIAIFKDVELSELNIVDAQFYYNIMSTVIKEFNRISKEVED